MPHLSVNVASGIDSFGDGLTEQLAKLLPHSMHYNRAAPSVVPSATAICSASSEQRQQQYQ